MAKMEFHKSKKKTPKPIAETQISKPKETYDPIKTSSKVESDFTSKTKKKKRGRPKSGRKSYQTVRLLKPTVTKINALENALGATTQDEIINQAIDRIINNLTADEKRGYQIWLEMFEKKDK